MDERRESIGPYEILEPLGQGGMGVVYRARHMGNENIVALKTVRLPRASLLEGIRREIRALAQLDNPGIVRVLEQGVSNGLPWYAMELVPWLKNDLWWSSSMICSGLTS